MYLYLLAIVALLFLSPVHAEEYEDDARIDHYEAHEPKDVDEAKAILRKKTDEMKAAYEEKDYETIHRLSYDLEAAGEFMLEHVEEMLELIEEVHVISEEQEEEELEETFPEMIEAVQEIAGN